MENMYDILARLNTVNDRHTLTEGRAVKEDDVEEGNHFTGKLAKARAAGKKKADLDGDGKMEPVKEAKKAKPDFLDVDGDGDRKESFKKAVKDRARGRRPVKESLRVIHAIDQDGVRAMIRHDREYDEYEVCVESDQGVQRAFADNPVVAHRLLENLLSERKEKKDRPSWPGPDADDEKTAFRKKFAPSVMRDPKSREELDKLDTEYAERKKTSYGRGEEDEDDEEGDKKDPPAGEKRGRGRPKKYTADRPRQERVTAKSRKADRTAWTPDRKKKKVKEQAMDEQTTASPARAVANAISQAIQRDYARQGFSWSGDQHDFEEFLDDQYADEAFVDDYHRLSDRARGSVMRAVAKAAREHFSGQDDVVDARGRGLMKGMREARHPQELDYQEGPEDDPEYRRHHGLDDHRPSIIKKDGKPVGEVGIDHYSLPGDPGRFYMKHYASRLNYGGYDSFEEAMGELQYLIKQGPRYWNVPPAFSGTYDRDFEQNVKRRLQTQPMAGPKGRLPEEQDMAETYPRNDFQVGDRVTIDFPGQAAHGKTGEIVSIRNRMAKVAVGGATGTQTKMQWDSGAFGPRGMEVDLGPGQRSSGTTTEVPLMALKRPSRDRGFGASPADKLSLRKKMEEDYDRDEYDEEGEMAKSQARVIADAAQELESMLTADENLPEWVQKKIALAQEYIDSARDYLKSNRPEDDAEMALPEGSTGDYSAKKARAGKDIGKPGKQFAKIAQSAGKRYGSKERGEKVAGAVLAKLRAKESAGEEPVNEKMASKAQTRDYGRGKEDSRAERAGKKVTRDIEYDEKVKDGIRGKKRGSEDDKAERAGKRVARDIEHDEEKPVKETTAGSVSTAPESGEKKSKGGMQFGKGVYEARLAEQFEREMRKITTEGLDVAVTANSDGTNTVTVTGKDVAPDVLQDLLQMAGMSGSREPVYQPVDSMPPGDGDMASMLDTLDGLSAGDDTPDHDFDVRSRPGDDAEIMPEDAVCERCGNHGGMHETGCDREIALEADLANSADRTETMSANYMVDELSGGLNGPKLQSNPNNPGDNPLAMRRLGRHAGPNLDLGAVSEDVQRESEDRLLALYRSIR